MHTSDKRTWQVTHASGEDEFELDCMENPMVVFILQMDGQKWLKMVDVRAAMRACPTYFSVRYRTPPHHDSL